MMCFCTAFTHADTGPVFHFSTGKHLPELTSAYPNPFTENTTIFFTPESDGNASINLYNANGNLLGEIYNDDVVNGQLYQFELDGSSLPEGVYFYTIDCQGKILRQRLEVVRK